MLQHKSDIIASLQKDILSLGGIKSPVDTSRRHNHLDLLQSHFPHRTFPLGAVHEFVSDKPEDLAVSCGFISGLISTFLPREGIIVWISRNQNIFPPSLQTFNITAHKVIFIHPSNEKDSWWCIEEALGCKSLSAVVMEMKDVNFTNSRRFQLAVEKTKVTGFILNTRPAPVQNTACVSRWKITSLPSMLDHGMPGIGHPRWKVELQKARNGKPGSWEMEWLNESFHPVENQDIILSKDHRKAG
jgi:protein ImuA